MSIYSRNGWGNSNGSPPKVPTGVECLVGVVVSPEFSFSSEYLPVPGPLSEYGCPNSPTRRFLADSGALKAAPVCSMYSSSRQSWTAAVISAFGYFQATHRYGRNIHGESLALPIKPFPIDTARLSPTQLPSLYHFEEQLIHLPGVSPSFLQQLLLIRLFNRTESRVSNGFQSHAHRAVDSPQNRRRSRFPTDAIFAM